MRQPFLGLILQLCVITGIIAGIGASSAAELKEARVTEVVKDVKLLPTGGAPRPATVSDEVRDGTAVRTGAESRSELKFPDQTLARLGANTVFSFNEGTRSLNLQDGAMLLRVPKGAGGAKISSSAVTAAITGTTVMLETHPLTQKNKNGYYKFIVLEGTARLSLPGHLGESILVKAGQMIIMPLGAKKIPEAVDVDIQKIVQSSLLITGFGPLGSEQLIAFEQTRQADQKTSGQLFETNLMIAGSGTNVVVADPNNVDVAASAGQAGGSGPFSSPTPTPSPTVTPTPTPSPSPGKFGTPSPITSPDPYAITSATTISTDPIITTNNVTDSGKIYQGPAIDGPFSAWAFGSTSAFDTRSGFDSSITVSGAAFKFNSLQLAGNPTVSTTNGQVNLGLVAINGITSAAPGGVLTFSGIRGLLLATQNGSINLGSQISFAGLHDIALYARGADSFLSLASDISTTNEIRLFGEGAIQVTGNLSTQTLTATAGSNISIAQDSITASEASLLIPNSGSGNIPGTASIDLQPAGSLALSGSNGLSLTIDNSNGGHIGQGGVISMSAADVNAGSFNALINNRNGGSINSFAQVFCNFSGTLTTQGDATFGISNRDDGLGGGTISGDAIVSVNANTVSAGGFLTSFVSANGGSIGGSASLLFSVAGDIHLGSDASFALQATSSNGSDTGTPGSIGSSAILSVNAANLICGGFLDEEILGLFGGHIHGSALEVFNVSGNITAQQGILGVLTLYGGGQVDGTAAVTMNAQNITTPSTATGTPGIDTMALEASIYSNVNGKIASDAIVAVTASQNISAPGTAYFTVANGNYQSLGAGTIGGNAEVDVAATNITTGDFLPQIYNYGGASIGGHADINVAGATLAVSGALTAMIDNSQSGSIGSDATIDFSISGTTTVSSDATFEILGSDGAKSAAININGGNYTVGGAFLGSIDGNGTFALNNATIAADVIKVGVFGTNGTLRIGGGILSANTVLHLYAPGSNGMIDFVANTTLNSSGTAAVIAANTVTIENGVIVTIGGTNPANVYANVPNYSGRNGGNNSTTGIFVGAGATTQALGGQPPFASAAAGRTAKTARTAVSSGGAASKTPSIQVTDSSQLAALVNNAALTPDGTVRFSTHHRSRSVSLPRNTITAAAEFRRSGDAKAPPQVLTSRLP